MKGRIKCTLCGFDFNPEDALSSCKGCFLAKQCQRIRCPNCGFETIPGPEWIKKLKERRRKNNESNR